MLIDNRRINRVISQFGVKRIKRDMKKEKKKKCENALTQENENEDARVS